MLCSDAGDAGGLRLQVVGAPVAADAAALQAALVRGGARARHLRPQVARPALRRPALVPVPVRPVAAQKRRAFLSGLGPPPLRSGNAASGTLWNMDTGSAKSIGEIWHTRGQYRSMNFPCAHIMLNQGDFFYGRKVMRLGCVF